MTLDDNNKFTFYSVYKLSYCNWIGVDQTITLRTLPRNLVRNPKSTAYQPDAAVL